MLALGAAAFTLFLTKCFEKGMILRWYYVWLKLNLYYSDKNWKYYLSKPLGTCIYCFGSWVFIVFYLGDKYFSLENFDVQTAIIKIVIGLFTGLGFTYVFIRIYDQFIEGN